MEFLTTLPGTLTLVLVAVVLIIVFDTRMSRQIDALECVAEETGKTKDMRALIILRLKVSCIWLLFLIPIAVAILSFR